MLVSCQEYMMYKKKDAKFFFKMFIDILVGFFALYLSWNSNTKLGLNVPIKIFYGLFAYLFSYLYILFYVVFIYGSRK